MDIQVTLDMLGPKDPPRSMQSRLIMQLLLPDLAISRGYETLARELDGAGAPARSTPPRAVAHTTLPAELQAEAKLLEDRSYDNRVLLASWDLMSRIRLAQPSATAVDLVLEGYTPKPFTLLKPTPDKLTVAVEALIEHMKNKANLDEIVFEDDCLDFAFALDVPMWPWQHEKTLQALDVVTRVAGIPLYVMKHWLNVERPSELSEDVVPLIPVPGHRSFPGGHSAVTHALAEVLGAIMGVDATQQDRLDQIAARIADNREIAGLHTRLDTEAGERLGRLLGKWMVDMGTEVSLKSTSWAVLFSEATKEWP